MLQRPKLPPMYGFMTRTLLRGNPGICEMYIRVWSAW